MTNPNRKTYTELIKLPTFLERFRYLQEDLKHSVGEEIFGHDRWMNQRFYTSNEWRRFRREIIIRDMGCDLGFENRPIHGRVIIHHINPITVNDIKNDVEAALMNPENVICCSNDTHQALHYGDGDLLYLQTKERAPFDTCPWRTK